MKGSRKIKGLAPAGASPLVFGPSLGRIFAAAAHDYAMRRAVEIHSLLRDELLQHVVLDGAAQLRQRDASAPPRSTWRARCSRCNSWSSTW